MSLKLTNQKLHTLLKSVELSDNKNKYVEVFIKIEFRRNSEFRTRGTCLQG